LFKKIKKFFQFTTPFSTLPRLERGRGNIMVKFRMVYTAFWEDSKVVEELTPEDKYFFLYLLTNAKTTQIGVYPITKRQMAFDLGYSMESVQGEMFNEKCDGI